MNRITDNMEREPLVSICCLAYNHRDYIKDALEGFLKQKVTFPYEVLIYDDASTDGLLNLRIVRPFS